jgi:hypothetical protein
MRALFGDRSLEIEGNKIIIQKSRRNDIIVD